MFRQAVSCARSVHALLAVAAGSAMLASPAAFGQFVQGDMYFASVIVPRVGSACGGPAVLRLPQGSWVGTLVGTPIAGFNGRMAYDRTRGVLLTSAGAARVLGTSATGYRLRLMRARRALRHHLDPTGSLLTGPIRTLAEPRPTSEEG